MLGMKYDRLIQLHLPHYNSILNVLKYYLYCQQKLLLTYCRRVLKFHLTITTLMLHLIHFLPIGT